MIIEQPAPAEPLRWQQIKDMKSILIPIAILLCPSVCSAGGDFVSGMVTDISGKNGAYVIRFVQSESRELMEGCKELSVTVEYERVPWFSWLPLVKSGHPSKKDTDDSIEYLKNAKKNREAVNFGHMGNGLKPTGIECSFKSKGLKIIDDQGRRAVVSYYDPM